MAWRQVGGQQHIPQPDRFTVAQDAIDLDRRIDKIVGVFEVALVAALHRWDVFAHHRHRGPVFFGYGLGVSVRTWWRRVSSGRFC